MEAVEVVLFLRQGQHAHQVGADVAPVALIVHRMPVLPVGGRLAGDVDNGACSQVVDDAAVLAGHLAEGHILAQHHAVAFHLGRFRGGSDQLGGFGGLVHLRPEQQVGLGFLVGDGAQRAGLDEACLTIQRGHDGPHLPCCTVGPLVDHSDQLIGRHALDDGHVRGADAGTQRGGAGRQGIAGIGHGRGAGGGRRRFRGQRLQGGRLDGRGDQLHRGLGGLIGGRGARRGGRCRRRAGRWDWRKGGRSGAARGVSVAVRLGHDVQELAHHVAVIPVHIDQRPDLVTGIVALLEHIDLRPLGDAPQHGILALGAGFRAHGDVAARHLGVAVDVRTYRDGRLLHQTVEGQRHLVGFGHAFAADIHLRRRSAAQVIAGGQFCFVGIDGLVAGLQFHRESRDDALVILVHIDDGDQGLLHRRAVVEGDLLRVGAAVCKDGHGELLLHHQLVALRKIRRVRLDGVFTRRQIHILGGSDGIPHGVVILDRELVDRGLDHCLPVVEHHLAVAGAAAPDGDLHCRIRALKEDIARLEVGGFGGDHMLALGQVLHLAGGHLLTPVVTVMDVDGNGLFLRLGLRVIEGNLLWGEGAVFVDLHGNGRIADQFIAVGDQRIAAVDAVAAGIKGHGFGRCDLVAVGVEVADGHHRLLDLRLPELVVEVHIVQAGNAAVDAHHDLALDAGGQLIVAGEALRLCLDDVLAVQLIGAGLGRGHIAAAVILIMDGDDRRRRLALEGHDLLVDHAAFVYLDEMHLIVSQLIGCSLGRIGLDGVAAHGQVDGFAGDDGAVRQLVDDGQLGGHRSDVSVLIIEVHRAGMGRAVGIHRDFRRRAVDGIVALGKPGIGLHRVHALLEGQRFGVHQAVGHMDVIHLHRGLDRGNIGVPVGEGHSACAGRAVGIDGDLGVGMADQLVGCGLFTGGADIIGALSEGRFVDVDGLAVLVDIVDGDDRLGRGLVSVLVGEQGSLGLKAAVRLHGDDRHAFADELVVRHFGAVGVHLMGAGHEGDLLEVEGLAVFMHVHHGDEGLPHRFGRGLLGGDGRGRHGLAVGEHDLPGGRIARLIDADVDHVRADELIPFHIRGGSPDRRGLPCPAVHRVAVQQHAALGHILDRHLHHEGHELLRLRHGHGGHIQVDRHVAHLPVHCEEQRVGITKVQALGVHLVRPGEGGGMAAHLVLKEEGVLRAGGHRLHLQGLPQGGSVHIGPIGPLGTARNRLGGDALHIAVGIRPKDADGQVGPDIRISGGKADRDEHDRRQQECREAVQPLSAIDVHGVSLLHRKEIHYTLYSIVRHSSTPGGHGGIYNPQAGILPPASNHIVNLSTQEAPL